MCTHTHSSVDAETSYCLFFCLKFFVCIAVLVLISVLHIYSRIGKNLKYRRDLKCVSLIIFPLHPLHKNLKANKNLHGCIQEKSFYMSVKFV